MCHFEKINALKIGVLERILFVSVCHLGFWAYTANVLIPQVEISRPFGLVRIGLLEILDSLQFQIRVAELQGPFQCLLS